MLLLRLLLVFLPVVSLTPVFGQSDKPREIFPNCLQERRAQEAASQLLADITSFPTSPVVPTEGPEGLRYLNTAEVFSEVLGTPSQGVIINEVEELKYLPFTLSGTSVLLVVRHAPEWNEEKAKKVESAARLQGITISMLWVNEGPIPQSLSRTIQASGGKALTMKQLNRRVVDYVCRALGKR